MQNFITSIDFLEYLTGDKKQIIEAYLRDFANHNSQLNYINEQVANTLEQKKGAQSNRLNDEKAKILYSLIRILKPNCVIETGVGVGFSSAIILMALEDNAKGKLHSIDFPNYQSPFKKIKRDIKYRGFLETFYLQNLIHIPAYFQKNNYHIPNGLSSGWAIPQELKARWHLYTGISKKILPILAYKVYSIDIFFHDSEHSEENMMNEFRTVWPKLAKNGLIISDNVQLNRAFSLFAKEVGGHKVSMFEDLGVILKENICNGEV